MGFWGTIISSSEKVYEIILKPFFSWLKKDFKNIVMVLLAAIVVLLYFFYRRSVSENEKLKYEIISQIDSLKTYKNKTGELYSMIEVGITDKNTLKKENEELYKEIKNLKDRIVFLSNIKTEIQIDTVFMEAPLIPQDTTETKFAGHFSDSTEFYVIDGELYVDISKLSSEVQLVKISIPADFKIDIVEKDKQLCVLVNSTNPYVRINNIDGAFVSPEQSKMLSKHFKKHWVVSGGIGVTCGVYDKKVVVVPGIQITLGYKFFEF